MMSDKSIPETSSRTANPADTSPEVMLKKDAKLFFRRFFLYTEGVAYALIIPVSAFLFFKSQNIEQDMLGTAVLITIAGSIAAILLSYITAVILLKPLTRYFNKIITGSEASQEETILAEKRFKIIPMAHCISVSARWVVIMGIIIWGIHYFGKPTLTDQVNMWTVFITDILLGGLIFYLVPERLLSSIAAHGLFHIQSGKELKAKGSLSRSFALMIIAIITITVAVTITVAHNRMNAQFKKETLKNLYNTGKNIKNDTDNFFESIFSIGKNMAGSDVIINSILLKRFERIDDYLKAANDLSDWCSNITLASPEKESVILASSILGNSGYFNKGGVLENNISSALQGKPYVSYCYKSFFTNKNIIMVTVPVKKGDTVIGILGFAVDVIKLSGIILKDIKMEDSGEIFISDYTYKIIAHNNPQKIMDDLSKTSWGKNIKNLDKEEYRFFYNDDEWVHLYNYKSAKQGFIISAVIPEYEIERNALGITLFMAAIFSVSLVFIGFFIRLAITNKLASLYKTKRAIGRMAEGDLQRTLYVDSDDEVGEMQDGVIRLTEKLNEAIKNIKMISDKLATASIEMTSTTGKFSDNAQNQAATAEEVTATVEEVSAGIDTIAGSTESQYDHLNVLMQSIDALSEIIRNMNSRIAETAAINDNIVNMAREGEDTLKVMNSTMIMITESSRQMMEVINIISDISDKINLLSLNAAIEAARAGDFGRGFAVVADEISKLADMTNKSISDIDRLIKSNDGEIKKGMESVNRTIDVISHIIEGIDTMGGMTKEIAGHVRRQLETSREVNEKADLAMNRADEVKNSTGEQKIAVSEIVKSISNINELTQSHASGAGELLENAKRMMMSADELINAVGYFKIREGSR